MIEWKEKSIIDETSSYPSAKKLGNHFQSKSNVDEDEYFSPNSYNIFVPELDMPITMDEVSDASKLMGGYHIWLHRYQILSFLSY